MADIDFIRIVLQRKLKFLNDFIKRVGLILYLKNVFARFVKLKIAVHVIY